MGFHGINRPFWGTPIYGNLHFEMFEMNLIEFVFLHRYTEGQVMKAATEAIWARYLSEVAIGIAPCAPWDIPATRNDHLNPDLGVCEIYRGGEYCFTKPTSTL